MLRRELKKYLLSALGLLAIASLLPVDASAVGSARLNPKKAVWGPNYINGRSAFPLYREMGVGIYSHALSWHKTARTKPADATNPHDPAYHWPDALTDAVREASTFGIKVNIQITYAPKWANGGHARNWAPLHPRDFAQFAVAAARKYPSVHLWSVWGEANARRNFMPSESAPGHATRLTVSQSRGPRLYANIVESTYQALKAIDPENKIIAGATFASGDIRTPLWIRYMKTSSGLPPHMDMYSHNPFGSRKPNLNNPISPAGGVDLSDVARLEAMTVASLGAPFGKTTIPLFLSEWCVTTARDFEFRYSVSHLEQARWIRAAFSIVNAASYINSIGWIHLQDQRVGLMPVISSGLLDYAGRKKLGFAAFAGS